MSKNNLRVHYISLEGGEGVGKTTLMYLLKVAISRLGYDVVTVREPGSDNFGEDIRKIIMANPKLPQPIQAELFGIAMKETYIKTIKPALAKDCLVISDRGPISTLVYQAQVLNLGVEQMLKMFDYYNVPLPDQTFWLKAPPQFGLQRIKDNNRAENFFDQQELDFHQQVFDGYQHLVDLDRFNITELDGTSSDLLTQIKSYIL